MPIFGPGQYSVRDGKQFKGDSEAAVDQSGNVIMSPLPQAPTGIRTGLFAGEGNIPPTPPVSTNQPDINQTLTPSLTAGATGVSGGLTDESRARIAAQENERRQLLGQNITQRFGEEAKQTEREREQAQQGIVGQAAMQAQAGGFSSAELGVISMLNRRFDERQTALSKAREEALRSLDVDSIDRIDRALEQERQRQIQYEDRLFQRAVQNKQGAMADIQSFASSGKDFASLGAATQQTLARQLGYSVADVGTLYAGFQRNLQKSVDTAIEEVGGHKILINKTTGATIKDLGAITAKPTEAKTSIVDIEGRKLLINEQTGETIKDLGIAPTKKTQQTVTLADGVYRLTYNENGDEINKERLGSAPKSVTQITGGGVSSSLLTAIQNGLIDPNKLNSRTLGIYNQIANAGVDAVASHAGSQAEIKAIEDLTRNKAIATRTLGVLESNLPLVESLADKVNQTNVPGIDTYIQGIKSYTGNDPNVIKYVNSLKTIRAEYAQMLAKGNVTTESDRREAAQAIPAGLSGEGYRALAEQLQLEAKNILSASDAAIQATKNKGQAAAAPVISNGVDLSKFQK